MVMSGSCVRHMVEGINEVLVEHKIQLTMIRIEVKEETFMFLVSLQGEKFLTDKIL